MMDLLIFAVGTTILVCLIPLSIYLLLPEALKKEENKGD